MRVTALDEYTIEILGEKHTLLNLIRWSILNFKDKDSIDLVGYTIPHPMEDKALIKIQMKNEEHQSKKEILSVFERGVQNAQKIIAHLETLFSQ